MKKLIIKRKNGGDFKIYKFLDGTIDGGVPVSVTVTGRDRRPAWLRMYYNPRLGDTAYNGNILEDAVSLVPGVGDAIDGVRAVDAANRGDYLTAGVTAAGLALPNVVEKPLKAGLKAGSTFVRNHFPEVAALFKNGVELGDDFLNYLLQRVKGNKLPLPPAEPVKYVDLETPTVSKGYIKGNEVTPSPIYPVREEGLTVRTARPMGLTIPTPLNEEEYAAFYDWLSEKADYNEKWAKDALESMRPPKAANTAETAQKIVAEEPAKQLAPKRRGRPPGSKNKPKAKPEKTEQPATVIREAKSANVTQAERYKDRKTYSKNVRNKAKHADAMELESARPVNSGQNKTTNRALDDSYKYMDRYTRPVRRELEAMQRRLARRGFSTEEIRRHPEMIEKLKWAIEQEGHVG